MKHLKIVPFNCTRMEKKIIKFIVEDRLKYRKEFLKVLYIDNVYKVYLKNDIDRPLEELIVEDDFFIVLERYKNMIPIDMVMYHKIKNINHLDIKFVPFPVIKIRSQNNENKIYEILENYTKKNNEKFLYELDGELIDCRKLFT